MIIDTAELDPTSSYKLLIGSVLPRAIAWVSTSSVTGVGNIAPVSFFTVVGRFPPIPVNANPDATDFAIELPINFALQ